jgi:hypothetical protein
MVRRRNRNKTSVQELEEEVKEEQIEEEQKEESA